MTDQHSDRPKNPITRWIYAIAAVILLLTGGVTGLSQLDVFQTEEADSSISYAFRNDKLLQEHYEKHGIEMGFSSAREYEAAASAVAASPDSLHKLEAEDGDDVYYLEDSNDFVIISTDGYIRTYFRPDSGRSYFDRQ